MKKLVFALLGLIVIVSLGVFEQIYVIKVYKETRAQARGIYELLSTAALPEEPDMDAALARTEEMKGKWLRRRSLLEAMSPHNETKDMLLRMAELEGYIKAGDEVSALATVDIILSMCDSTPHILGIHWEHIF